MASRIDQETKALRRQYQALLPQHSAQAIALARSKIPELIYYSGVTRLTLDEISDIVNFQHVHLGISVEQYRIVGDWAAELSALAADTPRRVYPFFVLRKTVKECSAYTPSQLQRFFRLARLEALRENVAVLSGAELIPLKRWAKDHDIRPQTALAKAREQRLPAFRQGRTWLIPADYQPR